MSAFHAGMIVGAGIAFLSVLITAIVLHFLGRD